jgi:hypothetical protein
MNNINTSRFLEDELEAQQAEQDVLRIIQKKYPKAFKINGNHKEYDLEIPEIKKTIEIKWDKESDKTGNYFIETGFNGKDSGLDATTADWWCIVDKTTIMFIPTESLQYVLKKHYCFNRDIKGQDGTTVRYKLIKKDILQSYGYATLLPRVAIS